MARKAISSAARKLMDAQGFPAPKFENLTLDNPEYHRHYRYALAYANYFYGPGELKDFTLQWVESANIPLKSLAKVPEDKFLTIGKIAWVELNGGEISEESFQYLTNAIRGLLRSAAQEAQDAASSNVVEMLPTPRRKSQAEVLALHTDKLIAEIEGVLDDKNYAEFVKAFHVPVNVNLAAVKAHFAPQIAELKSVLIDKKDTTGYEKYKRLELVSIFNFLTNVMTKVDKAAELFASANKATTGAKKTGVPAQKSIKIAKNRVEIAKACQKAVWQKTPDPDTGLTSLGATKIYGAKKVMLYNTDYRKVTVLEQRTADGLIIRGTTVDNFDEDKSFCYKLRKPKEFFDNGCKFEKLTTQKQEATGRLNDKTIIVRVW